MPRLTQGDIDAIYNALRPRLKQLLQGIGAGSTTEVKVAPHTHSADQITFEPAGDSWTGQLAADDVQEGLEEHDDEKLARDGSQPMRGGLDMDDGLGPWPIYDLLNLTFTGGVGAAIISAVRRITMTGIGLIEQIRKADFTGSAVGEGIIDQPRVIHMAGDDDDSEARIDGLEAVVFNDEPTKSYIQEVSRADFNTAVTPGTDTSFAEGRVQWDDFQRTLSVDVDATDIRIPVGWVILRWYVSVSITKGNVVYHDDVNNSFPQGLAYGTGFPWGYEKVPPFGVAMQTIADAGEGTPLWVMQRGRLYGVTDGGWNVGDVLWASASGGGLQNTLPSIDDGPRVIVGKVFRVGSGTADIDVDVKVLPLHNAYPGRFTDADPAGGNDPAHDSGAISHTGPGYWTTVSNALSELTLMDKQITFLAPAGGEKAVIFMANQYSVEVFQVAAIRPDGTGATVQVRKNGSTAHLGSALSLTSSGTIFADSSITGGQYALGDWMEVELVSVSGAPSYVTVQVDMLRWDDV